MTARFDSTCPHCGKHNDTHDNMVDPGAVPADGDLSLCIECGRWSVYKARALSMPDEKEKAEIRTNPHCMAYYRAWRSMSHKRAKH